MAEDSREVEGSPQTFALKGSLVKNLGVLWHHLRGQPLPWPQAGAAEEEAEGEGEA